MCSPEENNPQLFLFQEKLCAASVEFFLLSFLKNNKRIHAVSISATVWILLPPCTNIPEYYSKITRFIQGNIRQYLVTMVFVIFLLLKIKQQSILISYLVLRTWISLLAIFHLKQYLFFYRSLPLLHPYKSDVASSETVFLEHLCQIPAKPECDYLLVFLKNIFSIYYCKTN